MFATLTGGQDKADPQQVFVDQNVLATFDPLLHVSVPYQFDGHVALQAVRYEDCYSEYDLNRLRHAEDYKQNFE